MQTLVISRLVRFGSTLRTAVKVAALARRQLEADEVEERLIVVCGDGDTFVIGYDDLTAGLQLGTITVVDLDGLVRTATEAFDPVAV